MVTFSIQCRGPASFSDQSTALAALILASVAIDWLRLSLWWTFGFGRFRIGSDWPLIWFDLIFFFSWWLVGGATLLVTRTVSMFWRSIGSVSSEATSPVPRLWTSFNADRIPSASIRWKRLDSSLTRRADGGVIATESTQLWPVNGH